MIVLICGSCLEYIVVVIFVFFLIDVQGAE